MYKSLKSLFVTLLIVVLAACAPATPGEVKDPYLFETRTYYESLDLGTAESAVKTFVEAYEAGDFFTVYLTMTSQAIFSWRVPHMMFEFETLANTEYEEELSDDVIVLNREHRGAWNNFVSFMNSVRDEGALLFDFGNEVNILRTEQIDSTKVFEIFLARFFSSRSVRACRTHSGRSSVYISTITRRAMENPPGINHGR